MQEETRIPRPLGVTVKAKQEDPNLFDKVIEAYMRGLFPWNGSHLSMQDFSNQYKVPVNIIERKIKDGIASNLISDDGNLAATLEAERLRLLSTSLYRLGTSDLQIDQLLRYVASRVLPNPTAHPLLVKEFNSTLNNNIKLGELRLKTIQMLNDALSTIIPLQDGEAQEVLSREEILQALSDIQADPQALTGYLKDVPELAPHNLGEERKKIRQSGDHSYQKFPEVKETTIPTEIMISPH